MRSIDVCHTNEHDHLRAGRSRFLDALSREGGEATIRGRRPSCRGAGRFHDAQGRFHPLTLGRFTSWRAPHGALCLERGPVRPTAPSGGASDASVAIPCAAAVAHLRASVGGPGDGRDHRHRPRVNAKGEKMIRGAFHRQGPFVGSGHAGERGNLPLRARVPHRGAARAASTVSGEALASPWAFAGHAPFRGGARRVAIRRFARDVRRRSPADERHDLGSRSPAPDRSFWSAFDELRTDQTSPADFCNEHCVRAPTGALTILAGTRAVTRFPISSPGRLRPPKRRRGRRAWRAARAPRRTHGFRGPSEGRVAAGA